MLPNSGRRPCGARVFLLVGPLLAAPQELVVDINQQPGENPGSAALDFLSVGGVSLFTAEREGVGVELWWTDGTEAMMLADINPGPDSSSPKGFAHLGGDTVLFTARRYELGRELWRVDLATGSTNLVKDVYPGHAGHDSGWSFFLPAAVFQGELFFAAHDGVHGMEIWRSDGTEAGTQLFADLVPGGVWSFPREIVSSGDYLYISANTPTSTERLWRTDGTLAGLVVLPSPAGSRDLTDVGGKLFYRADDGVHGSELWATDGTFAGTSLVVDLNPSGASNPDDMIAVGGEVFFRAETGDNGAALWKSDGTVAGTSLVADLPFGVGPPYAYEYQELTAFGSGAIFYHARDDSSWEGALDLWFTGGTPDDTELLLGDVDGLRAILVSGELAYFANADETTGEELWATDGSRAFQVADILPGPGSSVPRMKAGAALTSSRIVFSASGEPDNDELWISDGTSDGTALVEDLNPGPATASSDPRWLTRLGDEVLFVADDGVSGIELWKSDGSAEGTVRLDLFGGVLDFLPSYLHPLGDRLLFTNMYSEVGLELWVTDGTAAGTHFLVPVSPWNGVPTIVGADAFVTVGDRAVFRPFTSAMWSTDGTRAGTRELTSPDHSEVLYPVAVGDTAYFVAFHPDHGYEVFRTDGVGDVEVAFEMLPGSEPTDFDDRPRWLTEAGGELYFTAYDESGMRSLHRTDSREGGVFTIGNQIPGGDKTVAGLIEVGSTLYFTSNADSNVGRELYKTDGIAMSLVSDIKAGPGAGVKSSAPVAALDDRLLFYAKDYPGFFSSQLWSSDGTDAGTFPLSAESFHPATLSTTGTSDVALFGAAGIPDTGQGQEGWVTDGTPEGTFALFDLAPGFASSEPTDFVRVGDTVFFSATTEDHGRELFTIPFARVEAYAWETIGGGCPGVAGSVPSIALEGTPSLGSAITVELASAAPGATALLLAGFDADTATLGRCGLYAGLRALLAGTVTANASGEAVQSLVVPDTPALIGIPVVMQWIVEDFGGELLGVAASSAGLELVTSV